MTRAFARGAGRPSPRRTSVTADEPGSSASAHRPARGAGTATYVVRPGTSRRKSTPPASPPAAGVVARTPPGPVTVTLGGALAPSTASTMPGSASRRSNAATGEPCAARAEPPALPPSGIGLHGATSQLPLIRSSRSGRKRSPKPTRKTCAFFIVPETFTGTQAATPTFDTSPSPGRSRPISRARACPWTTKYDGCTVPFTVANRPTSGRIASAASPAKSWRPVDDVVKVALPLAGPICERPVRRSRDGVPAVNPTVPLTRISWPRPGSDGPAPSASSPPKRNGSVRMSSARRSRRTPKP